MNKVKMILVMLALLPLALFAGEAVEKTAEAVADASKSGSLFGGLFDGLGWKEIGLFLSGMLGMKLVSWIAGWLDGKGASWVSERLTKLQDKVNENSVMAQIAADDALFQIVQDSIPELFGELSATIKQDVKNGKFDSDEWKLFLSRLWERVKPHVEGGKNDYLKQSSFADGQLLVKYVAEKWFKRKKNEKEV